MSVRGPTAIGLLFWTGFFEERPNWATGDPHSPYGEGGLRHSDPPRTFSPCEAATLGDAVDPGRLSRSCMPIDAISRRIRRDEFRWSPTGAPWVRWTVWLTCWNTAKIAGHSKRPREFRLRAHRQRYRLTKNCERICYFQTTRLLCMPRAYLPSTLFGSRRVLKTQRRSGAFSAARELEFSQGPNAFEWMGED